MATYIKGITLEGDGKTFVVNNNAKKSGNIVPLPVFEQDSAEVEVFEYGGATRVFNLSGIFVGTSKLDVKNKINDIESLIQGEQTPQNGYPVEFIDDFRDDGTGGSVQVKIMDAETDVDEGDPLSCTWNIKLIEASKNA